MAIIRNNTQQFTIVAQTIMRDDRLSLKETGLLVRLLSLPDNWEFSENGLTQIFKQDGQAAIRTGLKKLEEYGYLTRKRTRDNTGKLGCVEWTVYDCPHVENPHLDNSHLENSHLNNSHLDNRPQSITNVSSTNESIPNESITNSKEVSKGGKKKSESFDSIIEAYTQDQELKDTIGEFIKMRQRIRKPMTNYALSLMLKKLNKLAGTTQTKKDILNQSIINGWQDVYQLKKDWQNNQKKTDQWDGMYYMPNQPITNDDPDDFLKMCFPEEV